MQLDIRQIPFQQPKTLRLQEKRYSAICVRYAKECHRMSASADVPLQKAGIRKLRIRLGDDPIRDASTIVSVLTRSKRFATELYLYVSPERLAILENKSYLDRLQKAFAYCTRCSYRFPWPTLWITLLPKEEENLS